jgi:hypothetical protein
MTMSIKKIRDFSIANAGSGTGGRYGYKMRNENPQRRALGVFRGK